MIKTGMKTKTVNVGILEYEYLGTKREILLIMPYGLMANAPNDSLIVAMCQDANLDSQMGFASDPENIDSLNDKEFAIGIPTLYPRMKFTADGKINIRIQQNDSTDYSVRYNALETAFNQLKDDFDDLVTKYNTLVGFFNGHTHSGVESGGSSTNAVVGAASTDSSSTADISNAKIANINVPAIGEE